MGNKNPAAKKRRSARKAVTLYHSARLARGNAKNAAKLKANRKKMNLE